MSTFILAMIIALGAQAVAFALVISTAKYPRIQKSDAGMDVCRMLVRIFWCAWGAWLLWGGK